MVLVVGGAGSCVVVGSCSCYYDSGGVLVGSWSCFSRLLSSDEVVTWW
jgi:hypothetical protein